MIYCWFNWEGLLNKARYRYYNKGGKKELLSRIKKIQKIQEKFEQICMEMCLKIKKKQKEDVQKKI